MLYNKILSEKGLTRFLEEARKEKKGHPGDLGGWTGWPNEKRGDPLITIYILPDLLSSLNMKGGDSYEVRD